MFHELQKPQKKAVGKYAGQWIVLPMPVEDDNGFPYQVPECLNVNGIVEEINMNETGKYYFQNEMDAHCMASIYYEQNNRHYPYHDEWHDATLRETSGIVEDDAQIVESEVMRFI